MIFFGIEFAPLNVPMKRRLETLATAACFLLMSLGAIFCLLFTIYLIIFTQWRWLTIIYMIWIYVFDNKISARGDRRWEWVLNWTLWKYFSDYFPARVQRAPDVELNPKKNYLFCCFPHGIIAISQFTAFATGHGGFREAFPFHRPYGATLKFNLLVPFFRELMFALGVCDVSAESINYVLGKKGGGNVVTIVVGGATEAFYSRPKQYRVNLNNRRGFVKLAMKNGASLVPVISFGEPDLYDQVSFREGSLMRAVQKVLKKWTGIALPIAIGRGFFQYTYGVIPRRKPLTTLVGQPIDVEINESPTQEQIDDLHSKFVKALVELFEEQKHNYIEDAQSVHLQIE